MLRIEIYMWFLYLQPFIFLKDIPCFLWNLRSYLAIILTKVFNFFMKLFFNFTGEFFWVHDLLDKHVVFFSFQVVVLNDQLFWLFLKICYCFFKILYIFFQLFTLLKVFFLNGLILHFYQSVFFLILFNNLIFVFLLLICCLMLLYYNFDKVWIEGVL